MKNIPNCYLWESFTQSGACIQVLIPFGQDEKSYFEKMEEDNSVEKWEKRGIIYASTIIDLINSKN